MSAWPVTAGLPDLSRRCYRPCAKPDGMDVLLRTAPGSGRPLLLATWATARRRISPRALWAVWLVSRAILYLVATAPHMGGDVGIYQHWYVCCLSHGAFPAGDPMWQYPPGAALAFWLPGHLPGGYLAGFLLLAIGCDLAVTIMLCSRARRGGSWAGAWYWVCGVPLLGAITVTRFDVISVALAVAALCLAGRGGIRGALIGAGAAVKVWPLMLLAGTAPGQWRRTLTATALVLDVVCVIFAPATVSFLDHQAARGVEVESVAATPVMIWRLAGWPGTVAFRFGAMQLSGWPAALVQDAARVGLVLAVAAVLGWRLFIAAGRARWRPEFATDVPLAATLLFLVVSPVVSAQYLLWVTGLAAVCLATGRTTQRPAALAVLAAAALTQVVFPLGWPSLISGSAAVTGVLVARNALLVAATVLSCQRILRATSSGGEDSARPTRPLAFLPDQPGNPGARPHDKKK
jgi:Glycosyltransferase family 87